MKKSFIFISLLILLLITGIILYYVENNELKTKGKEIQFIDFEKQLSKVKTHLPPKLQKL